MVSDALDRDGYALVPGTDLIPASLLAELTNAVAALPPQPISTFKPYLVHALGRRPPYEPDSIYGRIATLLEPLAKAYLHAPPLLFYYNVWHSLICDQPPSQSQLWHQDHDDDSLLKAFYYVTDVDEGNGALSYVPGTHWKGETRLKPDGTWQPFGPTTVWRVSDAQMEAVAPSIVTASAPKGSLLLADTTGWHKGGYATKAPRTVVVWEWVTVKCPYRPRFQARNPWEAA